jgi:hypothetical protein
MDLPDSTALTEPGPAGADRLRLERLSRAYIQRIFLCVMQDRFDAAMSVWDEVRAQGDWMQVAVYSALPNTLRERIREHEYVTRRTDTREGG